MELPRLPRLHTRATAMVAPTSWDVRSAIIDTVIESGAGSKLRISRSLDLPRTSLGGHIEALVELGMLVRTPARNSGVRGRPAEEYELRSDAGCVITVEMGSLESRCAICDATGTLLATDLMPLNVREKGPREALAELADRLRGLLGEAYPRALPRPSRVVCSVGLPARIARETGRPLRPNMMPSWDDFPVREHLEDLLGVTVVLENDCNARALAEVAYSAQDKLPLIAVRIGNGIGAGIVAEDGRILHGGNGSAGDIGHVPAPIPSDEPCSCGSTGCIETVSAIRAQVRRYCEQTGLAAESLETERFFALVAERDAVAVSIVRESALQIGTILASFCNMINPMRIVIHSQLASASQDVVAAIRSAVYAQARPLATQNLVIDYSPLGDLAGTVGQFTLGREWLTSAENLRRLANERRTASSARR